MLFTIATVAKQLHKYHKCWLWQFDNCGCCSSLTPVAWRRPQLDNIWWSHNNTLKNHQMWRTILFLKWCGHRTTTLIIGGWNHCMQRNISKNLTQCRKDCRQLRILSKHIFVFFLFIHLYIHIKLSIKAALTSNYTLCNMIHNHLLYSAAIFDDS